MTTLERFSEKERDYHAYQARQNYLRVQYDLEEEREELKQEIQKLRQEAELVMQREKQALDELERVKDLLNKSGVK